jgi:hypothetical protein
MGQGQDQKLLLDCSEIVEFGQLRVFSKSGSKRSGNHGALWWCGSIRGTPLMEICTRNLVSRSDCAC